jgi:iron complex outermembrane recepter protein
MNGKLNESTLSVAAAVAAALGLCVASTTYAQTPESANAGAEPSRQGLELTEVIVTARRVEERLQDVPISITVFNQEQLTNRNVVNSADLAAYTPSLSANSNFGVENSSFAIRGFVQDAGTPPSVGVYFADVVALRGPTQGTQAGDGAGPGSFFDLQNVQVLKGPQGTLFGRNTTGGAVLFVPQKPTSAFEGYVEAEGGNYDMKRVQAVLNAPLNDAVRVRLAVDHNERDGYVKNISGIGPNNFNDVDYTAVRASIVVDVTSNIENYTIASYSHSDTNGSVQKLIACNPAGYNPVNPQVGLANFFGVFSCAQLASEKARGAGFYDAESALPNPDSLIEQWQLINTTTWTATDTLKVKNIVSYGQYKDFQRSPLFGTNWQTSELPQPYPSIFFKGIPALFTGIFPIPGGNSADQSTYTEELQLQGNSSDQRLTYQAGVYFEWSDPLALIGNQSSQLASCADPANLNSCSDPLGADLTGVTAAGLAGAGVPPPYPVIKVGSVNYTAGETWFRDHGVYAQSTYSLTDQLKLTGGLRGTWDDQRSTATRITNQFSVLPPYAAGAIPTCTDPNEAPSCYQALEKKSNKPTWLIDLDYKLTDDVLLYAKYARGYRAGGVFSNAPSDHRTFDPEKVDSYETGFKTSFAEPIHGLFNASFFYNNFSNQQIQVGYNARVVNNVPAPVSPTTAIINAGKSRIYGAEVEVEVRPVEGLSLDANYTYLNTDIKSISPYSTNDPNYQPGTTALAPGAPLALSPKNKFTIEADYTLPLPSTIGRVSVGATFTHTDKQLSNYDYLDPAVVALFGQNLSYLPATDLLNLNLGWNSIAQSPVDVNFFVTNVTDKQYYTFIPGLGSAALGLETAMLGQPRMYGARVKWHFGK